MQKIIFVIIPVVFLMYSSPVYAMGVSYGEFQQSVMGESHYTECLIVQDQCDPNAPKTMVEDMRGVIAETKQKEKESVTPTQSNYYPISNHSGFKSYESYKLLDKIGSKSYNLQQIAYTDANGFRRIGEYYLVAIGSHFDINIGDSFILQLENGTEIPCIKGDSKYDGHTDSSNIFSANGCCSEFIVSIDDLNKRVKSSGDASKLCSEWNSPVVKIIKTT